MQFVSLYCKQYAPRSDCSIWSSLIRVHSVCYLSNYHAREHLYICSRLKADNIFRTKNIGRIGLKVYNPIILQNMKPVCRFEQISSFVYFWHFFPRCFIIHKMNLFSCITTLCATTRGNLSSGVCEQQRGRPACASAPSDQHLCY